MSVDASSSAVAGSGLGQTLPGLVAAACRRAPGAAAVRQGDEVRDYAQLDRFAAQVAERLRALGCRPETRVALMLARGLDLPAAVLGVLRAGCVSVPIDSAHPADRVAYMLRDSGARILITDQPRPPDLMSPATSVLELAELRRGDPAEPPERFRLPHLDQLAYVLYTSGSTGRPKGVAVTHGALANCLAATAWMTGCARGDRLLAVTTVSFDIAMLELFLPLIAGGELVLTTAQESRDGDLLAALLTRWRPRILHATPALWEMLFLAGWPGDPDLVAMCGGDVVSPRLAARLSACSARLWHLYGPTEATMFAVRRWLEPGPQAPILPIGTPIDGVRVRIADALLRETPAGVIGDLCLGGTCLARGYIDRPAATAERFVPDPDVPGGRLYRTGDLARVLPDGDLELHGRADRQVKIRGHRIEPGEIEHVLAGHPDVTAAAVVVTGTGDYAELLAFVQFDPWLDTSSANQAVLAAVRDHAARHLPDVMLPRSYARVPALPVTVNGKVDRALLARLRPPRTPLPAYTADERPRTEADIVVSKRSSGTARSLRRWHTGRPDTPALVLVIGSDAADAGYTRWIAAVEPERAVWRIDADTDVPIDATVVDGLLTGGPPSPFLLAGRASNAATAFRLARDVDRLRGVQLPLLLVDPGTPDASLLDDGPYRGPTWLVGPAGSERSVRSWFPMTRRRAVVLLPSDYAWAITGDGARRLAAVVAAAG